MGKLVIVTAPSGAGKTTVVRHLLKTFDCLAFSVSATTRKPRPNEKEGVDYYFVSRGQFSQLVKEQAFVEWEELYPGQCSGTLVSEIERLWAAGKNILFDIDVKGAANIKKAFPEHSLAIFVKPPSEAVLFERLRRRKTESEESLGNRISRAKIELTCEKEFDIVLVNDVLQIALKEAEQLVGTFLEKDK